MNFNGEHLENAQRLPVEGGAVIEYRLRRAAGSPRGIVVMLHGLASNMTRWTELVEKTTLKEAWDMLRLDLRGHGEAPWRGRLDMETWCRDLAALLDAEGYDRAVFIGHSLGAQIAVHFGCWYPGRTAGLVLIDPILGDALLGHLRVAGRFVFLLKAAAVVILLLNRLGIHRRRIPMRDLRALDEQMRAELLAEGRIDEMVERYSSIKPDLKHFPVANFLQEIVQMVRPLPDPSTIEAPVLVVLSSGATYTDPEATRRGIERFPNAETVFIDAYHWPLTEKPDEIREAIERWVMNTRWNGRP